MTNQSSKPEHDQRKEHIAGFFSRAAGSYDRVGPRFFTYHGQRLVELAQLAPSAAVLDVACGRGAVLLAAAARVGPHGYVTGIDLTEEMVRQTAQDLRRLGITNAETRQMDAEALLFPDSSFDAVLCGFGIFFCPRPEQAMAEFLRVLKPGGKLAISTWDSSFEQEWDWFDKTYEKHLPSPPQEPPQLGPASARRPDFGTPQGLQSFVSQAGFSDIQDHFEPAEFVYEDEQVMWDSFWSHGTRAALERLEREKGPEGLERFKIDLLAKIHSRRQADGIHQQMPARYTIAMKPR